MATTKKTNNEEIVIEKMEIGIAEVRIEGITPLIVHGWSEKARKEMLAKQQGVKLSKKQNKNPVAEFAEALYWIDGKPDVNYADWTEEMFEELSEGARFGFPATAVKAAAISAAYREGYAKNKVSLQGAFFIEGEGEMQLVEIKGSRPTMREDMVVIGGATRTADLRYRPQFTDWYMDLTIRYNTKGNMTLENIINMIALGGMTCGLGEWRVEKGGNYGQFEIAVK